MIRPGAMGKGCHIPVTPTYAYSTIHNRLALLSTGKAYRVTIDPDLTTARSNLEVSLEYLEYLRTWFDSTDFFSSHQIFVSNTSPFYQSFIFFITITPNTEFLRLRHVVFPSSSLATSSSSSDCKAYPRRKKCVNLGGCTSRTTSKKACAN